MNLETYGLRPHTIPDNAVGTPARITAVHRHRFELVSEFGPDFAHLKAGAYRRQQHGIPTVGDFVLLDHQEQGDSRILSTLPRKSHFSRRNPSCVGGEQVVAANFDYVFILQSLDQNFNLPRLERYLTLAWQSGGIPAVLLTKADKLEDHSAHIRAAQQLAAGVGTFAVSAQTGYGLEALVDYLKPGKTVVFLGSSGVGKSTLVNALAGTQAMPTSDVREKDGRGRHTTSHRQLVLLDSGAMVIDTPGMRELGVWQAQTGLEHSFSDVEQYLGRCKFSDCRHQSEPGCAVKGAINSGALCLQRWERYVQLKEESRYATDQTAYLQDKQKWRKDIAKQLRQQRQSAFRHTPCIDTFTCQVCGALVTPDGAGTSHRNHCPHCLSSVHVDHQPGDRASLCRGIMDPIGVWVRADGEWAIIHRCRGCGTLHSNRIAADDDSATLTAIAQKPLSAPPFPL